MPNGVLLVIVMLSPSLFAYAVIGGARLWRRLQARDRGVVALGEPIERIADDVRRLYGERRELFGQARAPGRGSRTRALNAAYVDALGAACRALDVVPPQPRAGQAAEIARVESELRERGLDVRRAAVR